MADPMREHRRKEGAASAIVLLGLLVGIPGCVAGATTFGWGAVIAGAALACVVYYR